MKNQYTNDGRYSIYFAANTIPTGTDIAGYRLQYQTEPQTEASDIELTEIQSDIISKLD
jgi:hypothetical protein